MNKHPNERRKVESLLWALRLAVLGRSRPVPDDAIVRIETQWMASDKAARDGMTSAVEFRWQSLQVSGTDIAQKAGVLLAIFALAILPMQITLQGRSGNHVLAWCATGLLVTSVLVILVILTPKFKVWRRHDWDKEVVGVDPDPTGINHYIRLVHKIHHRRQLIAFERRVKNLSVLLAMVALVLVVIAL